MSEKSAAVRVQFFGICTHLSSGPDTPHRVLLVNASDQERLHTFPVLRKWDVKPHVARLQILDKDLIEPAPEAEWLPFDPDAAIPEMKVWQLHGARVTISGAVATVSSPRATSCIPHLSQYSDGTLPRLLPAQELERSSRTACIFDFPAVEVEGMKVPGGAAVGVIAVDADSAPVLEVRPIRGEGLLRIPLREGAVITISNIPSHGDPDQDHNADFLLHFLATGDVPGDARFPEDPMPCARELHSDNYPGGGTKFYTGPGCSNSNYP